MYNHSNKPTPFPTPQMYTFQGTAASQPSPLAPPTHNQEKYLPESVQTVANHFPSAPSYAQYPLFTPSHPTHRVPRSQPRDRGNLLPRSAGRDRSGLALKEFDDLGLPHFDLRYKLPESSLSILEAYQFELKRPSVTSVRIISRAFPWNIDITNSRKHITWKDMLEAVYNGLHKPIEDYEWPLLILDRDPQYKVDIETNSNTRVNDPDRTRWINFKKPDSDSRNLKRIDLLGPKTAFLGFKQDKDLEEMRRMPYSKLFISEVWVLELGMSERRSRCGRGRRIVK